ncbi:NmrA family NAD(P)-binding protein [soil metagenome]
MADTPSNSPVLVIGATGRHGNTGAHVVRRLREEGHPVRVLARQLSDRTDRLRELGADVVIGDLHQRASLAPALADVDRVYFTYPIAAGVVSAAANYAAAVREVDRHPRTVVMSMGPARADHPSDLGKGQWLAEQVLEWAGLDLVILRVAATFHPNILVLHGQSIREHDVIRNSFGVGPVPWISGQDAGELGVTALLHPERFPKTVNYPLGSELFTHPEIAALLSELLNRPIRFEPVTKEQWREELIALSEKTGAEVVNPAMAQHISSVGHGIARNGVGPGADPATLQDLIGRPPVTLRSFLEANLDAFSALAPAAPATR